jgi:RNA polymerase sigma factor (sigma-70 family)
MSYGDQLKNSQGALRSFVRSKIYNDSDVDDIIQNINEVALNKESSYEHERCFEAWVIGIAKYQILNYLKKQKKTPPLLSLDLGFDGDNIAEDPVFFLADIPFASLVEKERLSLQDHILKILTPQQKKVFKLLCLGYSPREIAVKLDTTVINITTTKYRLIQRAKAHLQKLNLSSGYDYRSNR